MSNSTGPGSKTWEYSKEAARMIALMKRELIWCGKGVQFETWMNIIVKEGSTKELNDEDELVEGNDWKDTFWGVCEGKGKN